MRGLLGLLLLTVAPSFSAAQTIACTVPHPGGDRVLLVTYSWDSSDLHLLDPVQGTVVGTGYEHQPVVGLSPGRSGVVLQTPRSLYIIRSDLAGGDKLLWYVSERTIQRVVPFEKGWLVLTSKGTRDGRPAGGLVDYLVPSATQPGTQQAASLHVKARRLDLLPRYNFWDLQVGDADGDGKPDIALCTWSKTRIIPKYAQRYFIYGWDGHDVYPRWRGSRLSKPYLQARLVRLGNDPVTRLLAVEESRSGRRCLTAYRWNDFGFTGLAEGDEHDGLKIIDAPGLPAVVRVRDGAKEWLARPDAVNGRVALRWLCGLAKDDLVVLGRFRGREPQVYVMKPDGTGGKIVDILTSESRNGRTSGLSGRSETR